MDITRDGPGIIARRVRGIGVARREQLDSRAVPNLLALSGRRVAVVWEAGAVLVLCGRLLGKLIVSRGQRVRVGRQAGEANRQHHQKQHQTPQDQAHVPAVVTSFSGGHSAARTDNQSPSR